MLTPGYGETPVSDDEWEALLPETRQLFGEPVSKSAVYDLEQAIQEEVAEALFQDVFGGIKRLEDLLSDTFLRELHKSLYGDIWTWAGTIRRHELNIGVDPWQISVQLRDSLGNIQYRWQHAGDLSPRQLGIAVHAEAVRIHPLTDGNGRSTRLLADLVFVAAQLVAGPGETALAIYDWQLEKDTYITLLRRYDGNRDFSELASFIAVQPLGD